MPKVKLTAKTVEHAKPPAPGARLELFDVSMPGFGLRVGDANKSWFVFYRHEGKQKRLTLGHYPAVDLGKARERAATALEAVEAGIDPAAEKKAAKVQAKAAEAQKEATGYVLGSFGALADLFFRQECPSLRKGRANEATVRREVFPSWKDRLLVDLRRRDLAALLDPIISVGHIQKAHKVRELALRIVNWGVDRGDLEANLLSSPSRGRRRGGVLQRHSRDRVLTNDELRIVWLACGEMTGPFPDMVKALILTGQRRDEVGGMQHGELDLELGIWTIPGGRYKTGIPHVVPLVPAVCQIIKSQPRTSDRFVFTTVPDAGFTGYSWAKAVLDKKINERRHEAGLDAMPRWTLHDLRRTMRTGLSELRVGGDVAERVIGHVIGGVKGVYDRHAYMDEKRDALERWTDKVMSLIGPAPGAQSSDLEEVRNAEI